MSDPVPEEARPASANAARAPAAGLPDWAREMITLYESGACSQFILHGNVQDLFHIPSSAGGRSVSLRDFLLEVLLGRHEVVLSYNLGSGIQLARGEEPFKDFGPYRRNPDLPRGPEEAIAYLSQYFRTCANLRRLGRRFPSIACILEDAALIIPAEGGKASHDLNALALQVRDWSSDPLLLEHPFVSILVTDNLNDLHPILSSHPQAVPIRVPLPAPADIEGSLAAWRKRGGSAISALSDGVAARQLQGATLRSVHFLLRTCDYRGESISETGLAEQKRGMIERECHGLIEFVESRRTLADFIGLEPVKAWLRQDVALWKRGDVEAVPKGYLFCGPVGTGKTFLVECLAGDAGIPVVRLKNFRDRWIGSTEGNLETIFRLIRALGRCYVFIDEADQSLGRRASGEGDSGLSGRVYAMFAEEMGSSRNRGRIVWILASSRPDLIEVDLKRPGRVDFKIPLFPAATAEEGFALLRSLLAGRGLDPGDDPGGALRSGIPDWLTPGAAEALAVRVMRTVRTTSRTVAEALAECLRNFRSPVPPAAMRFQIELAAAEASEAEFVPEAFRGFLPENGEERASSGKG